MKRDPGYLGAALYEGVKLLRMRMLVDVPFRNIPRPPTTPLQLANTGRGNYNRPHNIPPRRRPRHRVYGATPSELREMLDAAHQKPQ